VLGYFGSNSGVEYADAICSGSGRQSDFESSPSNLIFDHQNTAAGTFMAHYAELLAQSRRGRTRREVSPFFHPFRSRVLD